jgi:hypothetical protein
MIMKNPDYKFQRAWSTRQRRLFFNFDFLHPLKFIWNLDFSLRPVPDNTVATPGRGFTTVCLPQQRRAGGSTT